MSSSPASNIVRVAVPVPLAGYFDYLAPADDGTAALTLEPGQRVLVPFGHRQMTGVVVESGVSTQVPADRLQTVAAVLDEGHALIPGELLQLLDWCARYYKHPPGEVLFNALPPGLRRAEGRLPAPPIQYRLTRSGQAMAQAPAGRAKAQHRVMQALLPGPLSPELLRAEAGATLAILRTLRGKEFIVEEPLGSGAMQSRAGPDLLPEQALAVAEISSTLGGFACHLLDGITGSGKTEVYLQLIAQVLARGEQVLVLVPEIGLTPQLLRRFRARLGMEPVVSHSAKASGERMHAWAGALRGQARLLIGTRSALFLPLHKPGLIIMDESHDASFKQQDGFRYSARDVAVKRAFSLGIPIVLGTATPSLESLHNVVQGKYQRHRLTRRATGAAEPEYRIVDLRRQAVQGALSAPAVEAIAQALGRGEQALVFLNRRGYAPVMLCHECGWHGACRQCDASMTWHRGGRRLQCHHCGDRMPVPRFCPECRADALQGAGAGTEQLEQTLEKLFPDTAIHRVDRDRMRRKGEMEALMEEVRAGDPCILVGTQMLAKGHHFPRMTLVVIVDLDQALYSADFRAVERMGQILVQVAGRAGREEQPGMVLLQTHHPDHAGLQTLLKEGYGDFAEELLAERELAQLPPFAYQATLRAEAQDRNEVLAFLKEAHALWPGDPYGIYGPLPAMMERKGGRVRWYLLAQHTQRQILQSELDRWLSGVRNLRSARKVRWTIDLDPQEF